MLERNQRKDEPPILLGFTFSDLLAFKEWYEANAGEYPVTQDTLIKAAIRCEEQTIG